MDSFIDKLAQKFTAQEIIKANSSAEAEELRRTREQVKQYEACLEEMKNVNESMKESLEMLEQTLSLDLEKIGQIQIPTDDITAAWEGSVNGITAVIAENMNEIKAVQNEAKLQQDLAQEQMSGQLQSIQDMVAGQMSEQLNTMADRVNGQLQSVQSNLSGQMYEQLQEMQNAVAGQVSEQMQGMQSSQMDVAERLQKIQEVQGKLVGQILSQMQDVQGIMEAQDKLSTQITGQLHAVQDKLLSQMKAERALAAAAQEDKDKFSEAQLATLKEQSASQLESMKEQLSSQLGEQKEHISDFVHKENVKVYRNVQAVVVDEANKQYESMSTMINKMTAKNRLMTRLAGACLACSGLSLAATVFLILRSLGII